MADSVIIFGAGASYDAGIPLMSGFVERMWEFALRGTNRGERLSEDDLAVFQRAIAVRNELDRYHGRATFDDRNLEDVLSILSFDVMGGTRAGRSKLEAITQAIARTIELSCSVKHDGDLGRRQVEGPDVYRDFWVAMFEWYRERRQIPCIITFNYDLVLERSLFQTLSNTLYDWTQRLPFAGLTVDFHYRWRPARSFAVDYVAWEISDERVRGSLLAPASDPLRPQETLALEILKLHGSLNFPRPQGSPPDDASLAEPASIPYILPPIFNKLSGSAVSGMWRQALAHLRAAKNIVVVGYSLPKTDIYMQYFLKTAVGPNIDLNKITVYNPVLFQGDSDAKDMEDRYSCCFSPQLQRRIVFRPSYGTRLGGVPGTLDHFVYTLLNQPKDVLF